MNDKARTALVVDDDLFVRGLLDRERSAAMLREMGFSLAIDHLGSGYRSLSALAELEPAIMKIDMSIVRGIDVCRRKRKLVG